MSDASELAQFLRSRRERLSPAEVGLPATARRRTPGLRREEVATLAGVSVDYLVRLEQGRDTRPSASIVAALADALRLSPDERHHLGKLAAIARSPELCPSELTADRAVAPTVRALLDQLVPAPAFVAGPYSDVLAWNESWERLAQPLGLIDDDRPNLARYVFCHPRARAVYPDWDDAADEQARQLRMAASRWRDDAQGTALVAELSAVPEFASRWSTHDVTEKHRGVKRVVHPDAGELRLDYEVLLLPDDSEQRLITWLPHDDATAAALDRALAAEAPTSPARLRVVGDG